MHHAEQTFLLRSSSSAHELKEKLTQARTWAWKHRKGIIIAVTGTAGMIILVRKRSAIKELLRSLGMEASAIEPIVTSLAEKKISAIPVDVLDHRTGVILTPRSVSPVAPIVLHLHSIVIELLVESLPLSIKINLPLKCLNLCC